MRVPLEWLREYCDPELDTDELVRLLTLTGTKVESVLTDPELALDLEVTPNRPDCLSIYGIAREVHAGTGSPLAAPPWASDPGTMGSLEGLRVTVAVPELCPRFTARVYENVRIDQSPRWLKQRLRASGLRSVNNVVDVTNYVMLMTGQPLHAFDLDKVAGGELHVRPARAGERITTLDGEKRALDERTIVVADTSKPAAIAGVMGGAPAEIREETTRVAIEVASWNAYSVQQTARRLSLHTDASRRFEKGPAPEQTMDAQALAAALMINIVGAELRPGTLDIKAGAPEAPRTIQLAKDRVSRLLGCEIAVGRQADTLRALGFDVERSPGGLRATVPPARRGDVKREADLVEEIARFALAELPAKLPENRPSGSLSARQRTRRRIADVLIGRGLAEVLGWSLTEPRLDDDLRLCAGDERRRHVVLENPMSADRSVMRTMLLGSLLEIAAFNHRRRRDTLRLFETGSVYRDDGETLPHEHTALAVLLHGPLVASTWASPAVEANVFAAKALLEAIARTQRLDVQTPNASDRHPFLHPGRRGIILLDGEELGWIGQLHPDTEARWDLTSAACFELDLDRLLAATPGPPQFTPLTQHPPVREELSILAPQSLSSEDLLEIVLRHATSADVTDVYSSNELAPGRRSVTLRCEFLDPQRTLTDRDAAAIRRRIESALAEVGASVRGAHRP